MKYLTDKDVLSGIMFVLFGLVGISLSMRFDFGSTARPGPGFFPIILSVLLIGLGLTIAIFNAFKQSQKMVPVSIRPFFFVTCAVVVFAIFISRFGLAPSVFVTAFVASFSKPNYGLMQRIYAAIGLVIFSSILFIGLLQLPIALWAF